MERSVKALPFSGKKEDFYNWSTRFLPLCNIQGVQDQLKGTALPTMEIADPNPNVAVGTMIAWTSADLRTPASIIKQSRRNKNDLAMGLLYLSLTDKVSMGVLYNSRTTLFPDGNCHLVWQGLHTIYHPTSQTKSNELEHAFTLHQLTSDQKDPDEYFAELELITTQLHIDYSIVYDSDKIMLHIL